MTNIEPEPESGGGNFLTQKYGPLPAWAWGAIAAGGAFLYLTIKSKKTASTTSGTQTGTGTSTGTTNALTSNLVGVQQPTPILDGTYQVTVSPENAPSPIYDTTSNGSTQGLLPGRGTDPFMGATMEPGSIPASATQDVKAQTQSSSPQTQSTPTTG